MAALGILSETFTYSPLQANSFGSRADSFEERWCRDRISSSLRNHFDKLRERGAHLAEGDSHVLVRERIEFLARFLVERFCSFEISALSVKDRDCGLDQSLVEELQFAVGAFPDFFPCFVAFEEAAFVEEIDSLFVEIRVGHGCIIARRALSDSNFLSLLFPRSLSGEG
jgi:hypothetical protein